ncbi:ArsR/SmtB family transcription factor [Jiangella mangrovi]|uniref:DNA-binding transcriptional ArsR family regulator n=1 Tax=Jiangella mangrovi TaxID=1524084 RepID=A0A7W9GPV7_9ACTN|nr:winged helix-turn-helix domain-containing protein [Jiangella mangrovi]MBB5787687.1 DNA-binding transcriptional ArsR family regulator [Jiangella mangrovi]
MADQSAVPDYELPDELELTEPAQYRALFDDTRMKIVHLLLERAATTSELAVALDKPKGTVGHHLKVLEYAGLVHVVRTKQVRAIEARYYGRTARVFLYHDWDKAAFEGIGLDPKGLLAETMAEIAQIPAAYKNLPTLTNSRFARIPVERAAEWEQRLLDLLDEFSRQPRGGEVTFGLLVGVYPTGRGHLPEPKGDDA